MPLELMRLRLIDLIDHCMDVLRDNPSYIFHLDAQTVVLEDYLSVCPDKRCVLESYIQRGQLVIGPWYLQNDFYLTSGESTIRNLLEGNRIAESFGKCDKTGYAADQFGNVSQIPQILNGFGIDNFIFGRGACRVLNDADGHIKRMPFPSEFVWKGADGTCVLAIHMTYWYNNAQRFSADINKAERLVNLMEKRFEGLAVTPYVLLMNGVDHLEAQEDLLPILEQLNDNLDEDKQIRQYRLSDYITDVKQYIQENDVYLYTHQGELRGGEDHELLKGTLSSRVYLKQSNDRLQDRLEYCLEPLYSMLEMSGARGCYSTDIFRYMWKELMKNHPHDSICGCSRDEVHAHMEDRFQSLEEISGEMLRRGLDIAANHVLLWDGSPKNYGILAVNTLQMTRSETIRITLDFPALEEVRGFQILDDQGKETEFDILSHKKAVRDVFSPINLPGNMEVDRYEIYLYIRELAGMSFRGYTVKKDTPKAVMPMIRDSVKVAAENEYLQVHVHDDGSVDLFDKISKREIKNCIDWEETGDRGDSYIYSPCEEPAIYGQDFPAEVSITEDNGYYQSITVRRVLRVPVAYDFINRKREEAIAECPVTLTINLEKGNKTLKLNYMVENRAKDHRIRLLVKTGLLSDTTISDTPFDIIYRKDSDHYFNTRSKVFPNSSFVAAEANESGMAVLTMGQREYEHIPETNTLAFTVVRSTGAISRDGSSLKVSGGDQWICPENQCLRLMSGQIGIISYTGNLLDSGIPLEAKAFRNPLLSHFFSADPKKFTGGRPAVQGSEISELFYRTDSYPLSSLKNNQSFFRLDGKIYVSAFKKAEDGDGFILRLFNASNNDEIVTLNINGYLYLTNLAEDSEQKLGKNQTMLTFRQKEIKTIRIRLEFLDHNCDLNINRG